MKMNMRKNRFWTLSRQAGGFTLVELIVVIAILAILAGVGIPVYSGYIKQANMQADMTLISEIEQALTLAYYGNKLPNGGYVILSRNTTIIGENGEIDALIAAFGENWRNAVKLKYDGWNFEYTGSSFFGKETALLGQVDSLTDMLENAIIENKDLIGTSFQGYLDGLNISNEDTGKVADAAVLYVAQNTSKLTDDQRSAYTTVLGNYPKYIKDYGPNGPVKFMQDFIAPFGDKPSVASAAALYAFAEAYFQYEAQNGKTGGLDELHKGVEDADTSNSETALNNVMSAIAAAMQKADKDLYAAYFEAQGDNSSQAVKDGCAYLDILDNVNMVENMFVDKLGEENLFTSDSVTDIFNQYKGGGIYIYAQVSDGTLVIKTSLDK